MAWQSILEWIAFAFLFGFGVYTMIVIKNEMKNYLANAREIIFKQFTMKIPTWWGEVPSESSDELCFKRLDTRYEWEARFIWNQNGPKIDLIELFKSHIADRKILFDEETSIIYNPSDFKTGHLIASGLYEMVRLEGTATADRHERLYYDAFIVREKASGSFLYAESKSSVLNGLVEGPYFEEVMISLNIASTEHESEMVKNK
jgi:hypothetical protein